MEISKRIRINAIFLTVAAVFLCHPVVAFADVLPDFVGYLLLCLAVEPFAALSARAEEAHDRFRRMLWVSLGALAAEYFLYAVMPGMTSEMNRYERPVLILVFSLTLAFLQCWFLISAYREFFGALDDLAERFSSTAFRRGSEEKPKKSLAERAASFSAVFVAVSSVLSVLPEAAVLTSFEYEVESEVFRFDWYEFVSLLRAFAVIVSFVFGVIWLIRVLRVSNAMRRDRAFTDALAARFSGFSATHTERFRAARIRFSCALIGLGFLFTANARLDDRILLPGVVAAVLFCGGVLISKKYMPAKKGFFISAAVLAFVSVASLAVNAAYLRRFIPEAAQHYEDAYYAFLVCQIFEIAEGIATAVCTFFLLRTLGDTVRGQMTVYGVNDGKMTVLEHSTAQLRKKYTNLLFAITVFLPFIALGSVADALLRLRFAWIWWIPFLLSLAAFVIFLIFLFGIADWFREESESADADRHGE